MSGEDERSWRVGYADDYRFLDDEHEEMGAMLAAMKREQSAVETPVLRSLAVRFLTALKEHSRNEEKVMKQCEFGDYELHKAYHDHVLGALEIILAHFDRHSMPTYRDQITRHLENKLSEETLLDRSLATFLAAN